MSGKKVGLSFLLLIILFVSILLLSKRKGEFYKIPVSFSLRGDPRVKVEIEGKSHVFLLDSGNNSNCSIKTSFLKNVCNKQEIGSRRSFDIRGNEYVAREFLIPSIRIGKTRFSNISAEEENLDFLLSGSVLGSIPFTEDEKREILDMAGTIGAPLLRSVRYVLFDFPHSSLLFFKTDKALRLDRNFSSDKFIEIDLQNNIPHFVILVSTPLGEKRLMLDTGATSSVMHCNSDPSPYNTVVLEYCKISGVDFGQMTFVLYEMNDKMNFVDGVLGVDFFMKHRIFFNFSRNKAYIEKP